jgi:hypothetical protein
MTLQHSLKMAHQAINLLQEDQQDITGPLLQDVKSHKNTINVNRYCQMHYELWTMIKKKHQGKLTNGITLPHNNVHPHVVYRL